MFCYKCGMKNPDGATFCAGCGTKIASNGSGNTQSSNTGYRTGSAAGSAYGQGVQYGQTAGNEKERARKRNRIIGIIAVAGAAAAVFLIVFFVVLGGGKGGNSPSGVVDRMFRIVNGDASSEELFDLVPPAMLSEISTDSDTVQYMMDSLDYALGAVGSYLGDDFEIKYTIAGETDITGSELQDIQYDYSDYNTIVSEAKELTVSISYEGLDDLSTEMFGYDFSGFLDTSYDMPVSVIKVDNTWYMDVLNFY